MIDIGKAWKSIRNAKPEAPVSTITRDVVSRKTVVFEPFSTPTDIVSSETRAAGRFIPIKTATTLTATSGKRFAARIINVSRTGVAVEAEDANLRPDDIAKVGNHAVKPGRHLTRGIVFIFQTALKEEECGPNVVL